MTRAADRLRASLEARRPSRPDDETAVALSNHLADVVPGMPVHTRDALAVAALRWVKAEGEALASETKTADVISVADLEREARSMPRSRLSDPSTSRQAEGPTFTAGSQLARMLGAWVSAGADEGPAGAVTSEGVATLLDLLGSEYAKRASELDRLGLIRVETDEHGAQVTRQGASGRDRLVYRVTERGRAYHRSLTP